MHAQAPRRTLTWVLTMAVLAACLFAARTALAAFDTMMASGPMLLVGLVAVLVFLVGAALRIFRGSRATVWLVVAAVLFGATAFLWRLWLEVAGFGVFGALASVGIALEPRRA